jgi:2-oxo-4-hydroxy-4-carboxy-5-ureidoimidazoline decarboxylase
MTRPELQKRPLQLDEVNGQSEDEFISVFGSIFENSPWVAEKAWLRRPFATRSELLATMVAIVRQAGQEKQIALIQAHPDLAGRMAKQGLLTEASSQEQASAGLNQLSAAERKLFETYNEKYKSVFGFPFVICARLNDKRSILNAFERRLTLPRDAEIETALDEIEKIAGLRLTELVRD